MRLTVAVDRANERYVSISESLIEKTVFTNINSKLFTINYFLKKSDQKVFTLCWHLKKDNIINKIIIAR